MKIGIIGAGNVGAGLTKHLVPNGHTVMLSFSSDLEKATPWTVTGDALKQVGKAPQKKILWDCTNVLKPDMSGLLIGTTSSSGEEVAKLAPWAKVVKAIPPFAEVMHSPSMLIDGKRASVFVCGDDGDARGGGRKTCR